MKTRILPEIEFSRRRVSTWHETTIQMSFIFSLRSYALHVRLAFSRLDRYVIFIAFVLATFIVRCYIIPFLWKNDHPLDREKTKRMEENRGKNEFHGAVGFETGPFSRKPKAISNALLNIRYLLFVSPS